MRGLIIVFSLFLCVNASAQIHDMATTFPNHLLVIVDGQEYDKDLAAIKKIKDIEILKGAAADVLYGSRAYKGVVIIDTKKQLLHKQN